MNKIIQKLIIGGIILSLGLNTYVLFRRNDYALGTTSRTVQFEDSKYIIPSDIELNVQGILSGESPIKLEEEIIFVDGDTDDEIYTQYVQGYADRNVLGSDFDKTLIYEKLNAGMYNPNEIEVVYYNDVLDYLLFGLSPTSTQASSFYGSIQNYDTATTTTDFFNCQGDVVDCSLSEPDIISLDDIEAKGNFYGTEICDEAGTNCIDLSTAGYTGTQAIVTDNGNTCSVTVVDGLITGFSGDCPVSTD